MSNRILADHAQARSQFPVLVPEAGATGMVAVIRSLGRAGYPVHACAVDEKAIGLCSNFASKTTVHPPYNSEEFIYWTRNYVKNEGIRMIVPSEGFYLGIRPCYAEFAPLLAVTCDEEIVFKCLSKADVFESFNAAETTSSVARNIPRSRIVARGSKTDVAEELRDMKFPVFIKSDACQSIAGEDGVVRHAENKELASEIIDDLLKRFKKALIQEPAKGCKATVNFCLVNGECLAESMCLAKHESPHTGGLTSLRHTWWHQEMWDDAYERIRHLKWSGVAMMEYKWDALSRQFTFIEINSRYWAALHLDLFAGTDFPTIQLDALMGLQRPSEPVKTRSVTCRNTVPPDFGYAVSRARDEAVAMHKRLWALVEFVLLGLVPWIKVDLLFPGDRQLYFRQWSRFIRDLFSK